jgi:hypothetical protein
MMSIKQSTHFLPHIFEHDYVTGVLGIQVPLHESVPYSNALRQRVIEEQLQLEGFYASFKALTGDMKQAGLAMRYVMEEPSRIKIFVGEVMKTVEKQYQKMIEWMKTVFEIGKSVLSKFKPAEMLITFVEKIKNVVISLYEKVSSIAGWKKVLFAMVAAVGIKFVWDKLEEANVIDEDLIGSIKDGMKTWQKTRKESRVYSLSLFSAMYGKSFQLLKEESDELPGMPEESQNSLKTLIGRIKDTAKKIGSDFLKGLAVDAIAGAVTGGILTLFKFLAKIFGGMKLVWNTVIAPIKNFIGKIENPEEERKEAETGKDDPTVKETYLYKECFSSRRWQLLAAIA